MKEVQRLKLEGTSWGYIDALEGLRIVSPDDWIITGPKAEKWPVKDYIFKETYEIVDEN